MINLFKQFFSFKKLMKDRLVASFFYLGLVVIGLTFFGAIMSAFGIMNHDFFKGFGVLIIALFQPLFLFVGLRLICELMVALFEINDNLAPDGGKANTADIDVFETAKDAATKAAQSATTATKSVVEKTKTKINERKNDHGDTGADDYADYEDTPPPKPIVKKTVRKRPVKKSAPAPKVYTKKPTAKKPTTKKTVKKSIKKPVAKKTPVKKKPAPKK